MQTRGLRYRVYENEKNVRECDENARTSYKGMPTMGNKVHVTFTAVLLLRHDQSWSAVFALSGLANERKP